jgi:predicted metal-dependent enzyme (double-stranded beta helix superfamily)
MSTPGPKFDEFVARLTELVESAPAESLALEYGAGLLRALVAEDDWLPAAYAQPGPDRYRQYLLHRDPQARFSVVSFVWGPGQKTPVHDHTVWGLIGMLRGAEDEIRYVRDESGRLTIAARARLVPGQVEAVSPSIGDIHQVSNGYDDRVSISIHVYGADIGSVSRHVYDAETGAPKDFVSGYSPLAA